jgi:hypothetical protein
VQPEEEMPPMQVAHMESLVKRPKAALRPKPQWLVSWTQAAVAVPAMLGVLRPDGAIMGFVAYDCANASNRVGANSLLEPAACPTTEHHHEAERTIF